MRKYEYLVSSPTIPPLKHRVGTGPIMDNYDMEYWLNSMDEKGWEFVSHGSKDWVGSDAFTQHWWIFRRQMKSSKKDNKSE